MESRFIPYKVKAPPSDLNVVSHRLLDALSAGVARVYRHVSSKPGLYVGGAGVILMKWNVAEFMPANQSNQPTIDLSRSLQHQVDSGSHTSFLETGVGAATLTLVHALRAPHASSSVISQGGTKEQAVILLRNAIQVSIDERLAEDGCEVLYGRAGLLYALLFLRAEVRRVMNGAEMAESGSVVQVVDKLVSDRHITALVGNIIERGKEGAKKYRDELESTERQALTPALMWSWHGKRYLGGAHGVAGILQILCEVPMDIIAPHWSAILQTVKWLIEIQKPNGNWPTKAGRHMREEGNDELIQWCHGAPAFLILLATLLTRFPNPIGTSGRQEPKSKNKTKTPLTIHGSFFIEHIEPDCTLPSPLSDTIRVALVRGGELVYKRGLLRKGIGLCHGVAGSVYALLAVSRALDGHRRESEHKWLMRAIDLALLATSYDRLTRDGEMREPDRPYSLYEGLAGMCCAWAEVLRRIKGRARERCVSGMPGYDDLGR